ncbi:MAG: BACON domain-containing protein, partial [Blastocatellia bacterium]
MSGYTPPPQHKAPELPVAEKARRGEAPLSRLRDQIKPEAARGHKLSALDPREMKQERNSTRLRVGAIRALSRPLDVLNDGTVFQTPEGKLYLMRVASEGAAMTRLHFSQAALPVGARLFVYSRSNPDDYHALHIPGDDGLDVAGQNEFWTPPLTGEEVVVEYLAPPDARAEQQSPPFVIDQVSHIFFDPRPSRSAQSTQQNGAALCNLNVPAEWSEAAKSVGMFQFSTPKGEFACSGVLLNNAKNDGTPYFLTANHCLSGTNNVSSVSVYWLYNNGDRPTNETPRTSGGMVIATGAAGDFTLLRLTSVPPGVRFAGWTAEAPAAPTLVTSIHHPRASYKRFSAGQTVADACPPGLPGACEQYLPVRWRNGITEPGSSGAPLWTGSPDDPRVAGLLSGGLSSCSNSAGLDFYGRFDLAFAAIAPYLTGQGCGFALEPLKQIFGSRDAQTQEIFSSAGGDGSVKLKVRSGTDCGWTARSEAPWITLTSAAAGTGEATITYTVAPQTGAQTRTGFLLIAGHRLLVRQMGESNCAATPLAIGQSLNGALSSNDCRSTLDPQAYADRYTFNAEAGQQITLVMSSSTVDTFLLLFGPDGKVIEYNDDYGFSSNSIIPGPGGYLELAASGAYTIEATSFEPGETGAYTLAINRICVLRFTPDPPPLLPAAGGSGGFSVKAPPSCPWTARAETDWLTINTTSGNGPGEISYTAAANPAVAYDNGSSPRLGRVSFNTTNGGVYFFDIPQNYNCGFRVGPKSLTLHPSDVVYDSPVFQTLGVGTGNGCQWTATSNAPWLEFYEKGPSYTATGGQTVTIKATSLKFGDAPRTGTMTIAGETVSVTVGPAGQLCPVGNLSMGQTISDSLAPNCRTIQGVTSYVKQYKFQGRAGQRIAVVISSPDFGARLWLKRMDGDDGIFAARLTPEINFESPYPETMRMPRTGSITLPADGAYFLEVASYTFPAHAGSFVLSLLEASNASCDFGVSADRHNLAAGGGRGSVSVNATGGNCAWTATTTAPWIKLAAAGGNGSGALEYTIDPNTDAFRTGAIVLAGRHLFITQQPANAPVVVSAADYAPNLAIGAIHALFGAGLATQTVAATTQPLPTTLGGTQVLMTTDEGGSYEAPLFFVSPNQINFQMPRGVPIGIVNITVKVNGQTVGTTRASLGIFAPALFTADASGRGVPAAYALRVRRDGTRTEEPIFDRDAAGRITPRPIRLAGDEDVYLILYGTGFNGAPSAGAEVEATFLPDLKQKGFVVAAPGFAGLDQNQLLLPPRLRGRGDVP